jgi:hypothetical protein
MGDMAIEFILSETFATSTIHLPVYQLGFNALFAFLPKKKPGNISPKTLEATG